MAWIKSITISALAVLLAGALALVAAEGSGALAGVPLPLVCVAIAFGMQWLAFVPAVLARTEHFFDLWGATTYLVCVGVALGLSQPASSRAWLVALLVAIWALRLGSFLFLRVRKRGGDARFDEIKTSAARFLVVWSLQGLWVSLTLLAVLLAISARESEPLGLSDGMGLALWLAGFAVETIADQQKRKFRKSETPEPFISSGLWAWSRHPNYFGEILLWIGLALIASASMSGWQWLGLISPVFVFCLLRFGSGVPILERRSDEKFGKSEAYQAYKARTPLLLLRPPK